MRIVCLTLLSVALGLGQPVDTMLVLETSPGTEHATGLVNAREFGEGDRAGVVAFALRSDLLQPLTAKNDELAAALQQAGVRVGLGVGGIQLNTNYRVDLVGALKKACAEFGEPDSSGRMRAILVLFSNEDPNLSSNMDALQTLLKSASVRLYAVQVMRTNSVEQGAFGRRPDLTAISPVVTSQLMSRLAKDSGGRIYRAAWDLKDVLKQARKK